MLDPIEEAIEAIKNGEIIIVVDDEDMKVISFVLPSVLHRRLLILWLRMDEALFVPH